MLTLNRDATKDESRNRAYDSRIRERENNYDTFKTLDEDYENTVRENRYAKKEELWDRLSSTSPYAAQEEETKDRYEYGETYGYSSAREREKAASRLPYYSTEQESSEMAMKKYSVASRSRKRRPNTQGKIILAVYVMLMVMVATLVIVDSTLKTTAATTKSDAAGESVYSYVNVADTTDNGTNWFDKVCDYISNALGG